ncbi:MAG: hypothetical protein J0I21_11695 [Alphaproteobacteria bacterium]|nr:hypothetical protein [Alphaproteobacteria bacterium]
MAAELLAAIAAPLILRARRSPIPRQVLLDEAARLWPMRGSGIGRLALDIDLGKRRLAITELRVGTGRTRWPGWAPNVSEPDLIVRRLHLNVAEHVLDIGHTTLARIALHALGRWFERARPADDAVLLRDLTVLADADALRGEFRLATPSGGVWIGAIAWLADRAEWFAAVRTYLDADALPLAPARTAPMTEEAA